MNYFIPSTEWFQVWREHIRNIQRDREHSDGYQRAAQIAQTQYVMYLALELVHRRTA